MAYSNAVFYVDPEAGVDTARTALTTVTVANPSGTITRCTKTGHGLVTGAVVDLTLFSAWLNAAWKITVVDADNFDLDGAVWQATADANGTVTPRGGSSKTDAWKTLSSGATGTRIAAGDTIRMMASPDPTLVGDCAWTQYSKTVTLPGAVTATICDCETAWTGSANVTQTADASDYKQGSKSAKSVIAAGFTTGKIAYYATGTLDLSAYQQVSLWIKNSPAITTGMLELRLCSDTVGDVAVHSLAIPANPVSGVWAPLTIDTGAALNSAVASIAVYALTDPGSMTLNVDNVLACKAASVADSLTLTSLIGKVHNFSWAASTTYAANTIRRPTQPNRNGYCYQVTAGGGGASGSSEPTWPLAYGLTVTDGALTWTCLDLEDTWFPIQSISGTTVKIDNGVNTLGNAGRGYDGTTETVATYKRETSKLTLQSSSSSTTNQAMANGTAASPILFSGGWDRTSMATQSGETWLDGQNGYGYGFGTYSAAADYVTFENLNTVRCYYGIYTYTSDFLTVRNCHFLASSGYSWNMGNTLTGLHVVGAVFANAASGAIYPDVTAGLIERIRSSNNVSDGVLANTAYGWGSLRFSGVEAHNNGAYAFNYANWAPPRLTNVHTRGNATGAMRLDYASANYLHNCKFEEATEFATIAAFTDRYIYSTNHDQTADNHLITTDGGTIVSATDQRHTASGIAWKFRPTSTNRHALYPLRLSVAKIACNANEARTVSIWTRRDSTNIKGQLCLRGGQIAGVPTDVTVACEPSINTWTQSGNLTFTPTAAGVVEILFLCWDGVGTTNAYWIDDLAVT